MLTDLVKLAAEKARDAAEEYFKLQNIDMAIKSLKAARDFNPDLPNIEEYFTAYKIHELAVKKSTWYELLAITDLEVDTSVIRKQYKRLALMLHPDKNHSIAADGAFKLLGSALDVLTNPEKRKAYDSQVRSKKAKTSDSSCSRPSPRAEGQKFSRDLGSHNHKATDASSGFRKTDDPPRKSCSCRKSYGARVEINARDGSRKIIITRNGVDEDVLRFGAKDSSFYFCCGFFFGDHPPTVIQCS